MNKNQFLRKLLLAAACFAFIILNASAQNSIQNAYAIMNPAAQANTVNGTFTVVVQDTANVSEIKVMLGSMADSTNLVQYSFVYDVTSALPTGFSYARSQNTLTLEVGTFDQQSTYFGMVKIKNNSGSWSAAHKFITN